MLDFIDKYKYGIVAMFGMYMVLFIVLQMASYKEYIHYPLFHEGALMEQDESIELTADQIEAGDYSSEEVSSIARDAFDERQRSDKDFTQNKTIAEAEQDVYDLEKKCLKKQAVKPNAPS